MCSRKPQRRREKDSSVRSFLCLFRGSHDYSCRLWTQGGRYLGTLGTVLPWSKLSPFERAGEDTRQYRLPPDIKKVASSTTLKVVSGIQHSMTVKRKVAEDRDDDRDIEDTASTDLKSMFDKPLKDPILGKHFCLPGRTAVEQHIQLDTSQLFIPVYTHLRVYPSEIMESVPTPPVIGQVRAENYLNHYLPVQGKVDLQSSAINIREPQRMEHRPAGGGTDYSLSPFLAAQDKLDFALSTLNLREPGGASTSAAATATGQRRLDLSMKMSPVIRRDPPGQLTKPGEKASTSAAAGEALITASSYRNLSKAKCKYTFKLPKKNTTKKS